MLFRKLSSARVGGAVWGRHRVVPSPAGSRQTARAKARWGDERLPTPGSHGRQDSTAGWRRMRAADLGLVSEESRRRAGGVGLSYAVSARQPADSPGWRWPSKRSTPCRSRALRRRPRRAPHAALRISPRCTATRSPLREDAAIAPVASGRAPPSSTKWSPRAHHETESVATLTRCSRSRWSPGRRVLREIARRGPARTHRLGAPGEGKHAISDVSFCPPHGSAMLGAPSRGLFTAADAIWKAASSSATACFHTRQEIDLRRHGSRSRLPGWRNLEFPAACPPWLERAAPEPDLAR